MVRRWWLKKVMKEDFHEGQKQWHPFPNRNYVRALTQIAPQGVTTDRGHCVSKTIQYGAMV